MYAPFANSGTSQQGVVAPGGDVTINNGIINVIDDSHNHIIDNVDGLSDALNGKLDKTGGTMSGALRVNSTIFAYNYGTNFYRPAFIFDKQGTHYTGIGACGILDTIKFGPVNTDLSDWVSDYYQKWKFQGDVIADRNIYVGSDAVIHAGNIGSQSVHSADILTINNTESKTAGRLQYFQVNNNTDISPATTAAPWWHVIRCQHAGYTNGYWRDLAFDFFSNDIKTRKNQDGVLGSWATLISSDNIGSQHVDRATRTDAGYTNDIFASALALTVDGLYFYKMGGSSYTGTGLPDGAYKYGVATIEKRGSDLIITLSYASYNTYYKYYKNSAWSDWYVNIDANNIGSQSVSYATTAGTIDGFTRTDSTKWGTQIGKAMFEWATAKGGGIQYREEATADGGAVVHMLIDGTIYVNEGASYVIHSGNISLQSVNYANSANSATYALFEASTGSPLIHTGNIGSQHVASASCLTSSSTSGITCDEYGNFKPQTTGAGYWCVMADDGKTERFAVKFDGTGVYAGNPTNANNKLVTKAELPSFSYSNGVLTIS
jgi:hypothetical protein